MKNWAFETPSLRANKLIATPQLYGLLVVQHHQDKLQHDKGAHPSQNPTPLEDAGPIKTQLEQNRNNFLLQNIFTLFLLSQA